MLREPPFRRRWTSSSSALSAASLLGPWWAAEFDEQSVSSLRYCDGFVKLPYRTIWCRGVVERCVADRLDSASNRLKCVPRTGNGCSITRLLVVSERQFPIPAIPLHSKTPLLEQTNFFFHHCHAGFADGNNKKYLTC